MFKELTLPGLMVAVILGFLIFTHQFKAPQTVRVASNRRPLTAAAVYQSGYEKDANDALNGESKLWELIRDAEKITRVSLDTPYETTNSQALNLCIRQVARPGRVGFGEKRDQATAYSVMLWVLKDVVIKITTAVTNDDSLTPEQKQERILAIIGSCNELQTINPLNISNYVDEVNKIAKRLALQDPSPPPSPPPPPPAKVSIFDVIKAGDLPHKTGDKDKKGAIAALNQLLSSFGATASKNLKRAIADGKMENKEYTKETYQAVGALQHGMQNYYTSKAAELSLANKPYFDALSQAIRTNDKKILGTFDNTTLFLTEEFVNDLNDLRAASKKS